MMNITQITVGPMGNYCYIVKNPAQKKCVVIDPGWDIKKIETSAEQDGFEMSAILLTHGHFDHSQAAVTLAKNHCVPVYVEVGDADMVSNDCAYQLTTFCGDASLKIAGMEIEIYATSGHTKGSACILIDNNLFTGDTLFVNAVGRVDLPESNPEQMYNSLKKIVALNPHYKVYPGHAYGDKASTTIAESVSKNPYIKLALKDKDAFIEAMS